MDYLQVLRGLDFTFLKRYGQNFITDVNLLRAIAADADVCGSDTVVEVGAGAGTLTAAIAERAKRVIAFEIDTELKPVLEKTLEGINNVDVVFEDALKVKSRYTPSAYGVHPSNGGELLPPSPATPTSGREAFPSAEVWRPQADGAVLPDGPFKLVANIPYYITTPLIFKFIEEPNLISMTVMVQSEVAERITAKAGDKNYGAVTAQIAALGEAKITRRVSRKCFTPPPNVDSAVVHIKINKKKEIKNYPLLKKLIASAFGMRRKTLANNLMKDFCLPRQKAEALIESAGFDKGIRGEKLSVDDFIKLADKF